MCFLGVVILATSVSDANAATKKAYKHRVVNPPRVVVKNVGGLALSIEGAGFKYMGPQLKRLLKSDSFPLSGKDLEVPSFRPPTSTKIFTVVAPDSQWASVLQGRTSISRGKRTERKTSKPDSNGNVTTYYYTYGTYKVEAQVQWKGSDGTVFHSDKLLDSGEVQASSTKGYPNVPDVTKYVKREFEQFATKLVSVMRPAWSVEKVFFRMDRTVGKLMRSFYKKRGGISFNELYFGLSDLVKADPSNATALHNLGVVSEMFGALEEAEQRYKQAVSLEPKCIVCGDAAGWIKDRLKKADRLALQGVIVRGSLPKQGETSRDQGMSDGVTGSLDVFSGGPGGETDGNIEDALQPAKIGPKHGASKTRCPKGTKLVGKSPPKGDRQFCQHKKEGHKTGPYAEWHPSRQPKVAGTFLRDKRHGKWAWWSYNGQKEQSGEYRHGVAHGLRTNWFENGQKQDEIEYANDKEHGMFTTWRESGCKRSEGQFKDGEVHGKKTLWDENGNKQEEVEYKDGKAHGRLTAWHENGKKTEGWLKDGKLHGKTTVWYQNGQKLSEGQYLNGKKHGKFTSWDKNGQGEKVTEFEFGEQVVELSKLREHDGLKYAPNQDRPYNGRALQLHDNGQKKTERKYKDGKVLGKSTEWYRDGQKHSEVEYKDGQRHGKWTFWHENGEKSGESVWFRGLLVPYMLEKVDSGERAGRGEDKACWYHIKLSAGVAEMWRDCDTRWYENPDLDDSIDLDGQWGCEVKGTYTLTAGGTPRRLSVHIPSTVAYCMGPPAPWERRISGSELTLRYEPQLDGFMSGHMSSSVNGEPGWKLNLSKHRYEGGPGRGSDHFDDGTELDCSDGLVGEGNRMRCGYWTRAADCNGSCE